MTLSGGSEAVADRIAAAPEAFVAQLSAGEIARACTLLDDVPEPGSVRVAVTPATGAGKWYVDVAGSDRPRLLTAIAGALTTAGLDIDTAAVAGWADGAVLDAFVVRSPIRPDVDRLTEAIGDHLGRPLTAAPVKHARVRFSEAGAASICDLRAADRPGLLHAVTAAFAAAGAEVQAARIMTVRGQATNRFTLSDGGERAIDATQEAAIRACLRWGVVGGRPRRTSRLR